MSEAKRGRPPKKGAKVILGYAREQLIKEGIAILPISAEEAREADDFVWRLDHLDLLADHPDLLDVINAHTELKMFFDLRMQLGTTSMLIRKMLDAGLRTGIEEVMQTKRRKTSRSKPKKRAIKTKEHAKALKINNGGKLPPKYWISIAESLFKDGFTGRGGEYVSERTILNDLKPPKK